MTGRYFNRWSCLFLLTGQNIITINHNFVIFYFYINGVSPTLRMGGGLFLQKFCGKFVGQGFPYWGDGGRVPITSQKLAHPPSHLEKFLHHIFITLPPPPILSLHNNFHACCNPITSVLAAAFIFNCSHCSCTTFILTSYFLYT